MATVVCPRCGSAVPPGVMTCPRCGSPLGPSPAGGAWMAAPPMAFEPAEAQSIRSMLHIIRILAIIFGILLAIGGVAYAAFVALAFNACNTASSVINFSGPFCGQALWTLLIAPIFFLIFGVVDVIVYLQMRHIEELVNQRQFEQAKSTTLVWMIVGFVLGGILLGILLLVAYLKFDPLVNWQRAGYPSQSPPPMYVQPPVVPQAAPAAAICPRCGRPATYIPQYGRYYCYTDQQYL